MMDLGLLYLCSERVLGGDHDVTGLVGRAHRSGFFGDAQIARDAVALLPPHQHSRLMTCLDALSTTREARAA